MDILSRQIGQNMVISLAGSVDALTAPEVSDFLSGQVTAGHRQLILDLTGVEFMSSAGLRAILGALKESRQGGGDLRLAGAQPGVEKILKMSGFTNILKAFPSLEAALSSYSD